MAGSPHNGTVADDDLLRMLAHDGNSVPLRAVSALVSAVRDLFGNTPPNSPVANNWAQQNPEIAVLIGIIVLLAVFVPLAIRKFARVSSR